MIDESTSVLPPGLLLSFYGDDFTGSTDAMEALTIRGVPTVLFTDAPSPASLARFPDCRAAGVAGISRSQTPDWMSANLPPMFRSLKTLNAPVFHYKVCSTFDSAPHVGSIGRAIELARDVFGSASVPIVVGAPALKRYLVFGNLFATADGATHRIDRHPTMSKHPVTPMDEGDLRRHLARQTSLPVGLVDLLAVRAGRGREEFQRLRASGVPLIFIDTLDEASMLEAGRIVWEDRESGGSFVPGSSGVEYALVDYWRSRGWLPEPPVFADLREVSRILVVSGSCAPGSARQIEWAVSRGFHGIPVDAAKLVDDAAESDRIAAEALAALGESRSVVVYSALGPEHSMRLDRGVEFGNRLGERLASLAASIVEKSKIERCIIAGGDTSGQAARAIGIEALRVRKPTAPGAPICDAWRSGEDRPSLEILLKGGQLGGPELFGQVKFGG